MKSLVRVPGGLAFFIAAFLNAFVDLGHKITIQNTVFKVYEGSTQVILTALVNGLILLPFIFLVVPAGRVTDRFRRHRVMQIAAWVSVALALGVALFYHLGWWEGAFAMTFLLAAQSAFYSPAKFAYLKSLFGAENLARANGIAQAVAIVAILAGTLVFSIAFEALLDSASSPGPILVQVSGLGWLLVAGALMELACLYRLPAMDTVQPQANSQPKPPMRELVARPLVARTILGISLFWGIGQVVLAIFPAFVESRTGIHNAALIQASLSMSGIGIAVGAVLAGRLSADRIETGLIPVGALVICLSLGLMPLAQTLTSIAFLNFTLGIGGGLFLISLNALLQFHSPGKELGSVISVRNFFSNICMAGFLVATMLLSQIGLGETGLLILLAVVALIGTSYTVKLLPYSLTRLAVQFVMAQRYRLKVQGIEHIPPRGGVLMLGNHISWIDWAMIQIASPRPIRFVMARTYYDRWYLRWLLDAAGCIPIEAGANSKQALEKVAEALNQGDVVCLFPEGALTPNGQLQEFKRGYETAIRLAGTEIPILPFHLHGLWGSRLSRSSDGFKQARALPGRREVVVTFGETLPGSTPAEALKQHIFELSVHAWNEYTNSLEDLGSAWVRSGKQLGNRALVHDDLSGSLSAHRLLVGSSLMARRINQQVPGQYVGLMLPFSAGGLMANMATLQCGKTLVNLNYTASADALQFACHETGIKTIFTARRFVDQLLKRGIDVKDMLPDLEMVYLEDMRESFRKSEALLMMLKVKLLPFPALKRLVCRKPETDVAAVIYSSGSEGSPKGVVLRHRNLIANVKQTAEALQPEPEDVMMGSLPLFHAFGLTVAQFLPLLEGVPVVCQPDPTDVLAVAKNVAKHKGTILVGTSTFLRFYCRNSKVEPLMLESLRLVVAGAEKLSPDVRVAFESKFHKIIYEGYGMTEAAPVVSVNLPDELDTQRWRRKESNRVGTVGQPLAGTAIRICDPETWLPLPVGAEGMVMVAGPQVMPGYLNQPEKSSAVLIEQDGLTWYASGDKGRLDEDGFLTLIDRYSRMAKLGGEMISLGAVEQVLRTGLMEQGYAGDLVATSVEDKRKGEKLVVLLDADYSQKAINDYLKKSKTNALMRPAAWLQVDEIPRLGAGKVDFTGVKKLAAEMV